MGALVTSGCLFPGKERLTHAEARRKAADLNRFAFDGGRVVAYRCPGGEHWHVGHRRRRPGQPRQWRRR